jgi:hypothetical protein
MRSDEMMDTIRISVYFNVIQTMYVLLGELIMNL